MPVKDNSLTTAGSTSRKDGDTSMIDTVVLMVSLKKGRPRLSLKYALQVMRGEHNQKLPVHPLRGENMSDLMKVKLRSPFEPTTILQDNYEDLKCHVLRLLPHNLQFLLL